jgi:DNA-binding transcriptional ArsR family regulator
VDAAVSAIAEPHRRAILGLIATSELSAGEIAGHFDVTRPAISQHLRVLRTAGLVSDRKAGTRRLYRARREGLAGLREWLDSFWRDGLEQLRIEAEREAKRTR